MMPAELRKINEVFTDDNLIAIRLMERGQSIWLMGVPRVVQVRQSGRRAPVVPPIEGAQSAHGVTIIELDDDESAAARHEPAVVPPQGLRESESKRGGKTLIRKAKRHKIIETTQPVATSTGLETSSPQMEGSLKGLSDIPILDEIPLFPDPGLEGLHSPSRTGASYLASIDIGETTPISRATTTNRLGGLHMHTHFTAPHDISPHA